MLLSSKNALISSVIPAVAVLQHFFNRDDGEKYAAVVCTMKQEFHDTVESRFEYVLTEENYIVANTVDHTISIDSLYDCKMACKDCQSWPNSLTMYSLF